MTLPDPWQPLRRLTAARIALGRTGSSLPTGAHLDFQLAHARARDAVRHVADFDAIAAALAREGLATVPVASEAQDHGTYLLRPDLGRLLAAGSRETLARHASRAAWDLALVIGDGLSGQAVERHAPELARLVTEALTA
ncbi:MAG TPA: ethanolamine ammonia-lyase light chain EutC, partial [Gemmatimonadales bacterium]|nr:ethanolamine ammonia-lyase light chain EutC [Gemmatimonadales bacterium]